MNNFDYNEQEPMPKLWQPALCLLDNYLRVAVHINTINELYLSAIEFGKEKGSTKFKLIWAGTDQLDRGANLAQKINVKMTAFVLSCFIREGEIKGPMIQKHH